MTFDEVLTQVLDLLQRDKRISYRALKVRFQLDDDLLEAVKDELIYAKKGCVPPFTHSALKRAVLLMMPAVRHRLHMDPHGSNMHLSKTKSIG